MGERQKKGLKEKTISGVIWSFMERVLAQGVSFVVSIVLARLLMPEEYGLIAIVLVVINICNVFFNSGFSTSLIQKKDADELDFSTAFWSSLVLAVTLYAGVFFLAGLVADFYNQDILRPVIRIMGLSLIVSSLKSIQKAYVSRKMQFRKFFWATLGGTLAAAVAGIWMAVKGWGVWALVAQYLINLTIDTVILSLMIHWRPRWIFSAERLKNILSFGWKVLTAGLIYTIYEDLRSLIIGKVYSADELAFYNKGKQLPGFLVNNINSAVSSTLLPALSSIQNDQMKIKAVLKRFNRISAFIMMPMMVGLALVAEPVVLLLLKEKWLFCVPFLRMMCVYYAFMPMQEGNVQAVLAVGRSDISLKAEIIKRTVNVLIILITFRISVKALVWGEIVSMVITIIVNTVVSRRLFEYGTIEQFKDIGCYVVASLLMGAIVYTIFLFKWNMILTLLIQMVVGVGVYIILLIIVKDESIEYVRKLLGELGRLHKA